MFAWPGPIVHEPCSFERLYPLNPSLADEMSRLFLCDTPRSDLFLQPLEEPKIDSILEEFRRNGSESEYCPELDEHLLMQLLQQESDRMVAAAVSIHDLGPPRPPLVPTYNEDSGGSGERSSGGENGGTASGRRNRRRNRGHKKGDKFLCVFCKNNGESEDYYTGHSLKDEKGNVTCPILYKYTCPICSAHGANSHTLKYCPKNTNRHNEQGQLTKMMRNAAGRLRTNYQRSTTRIASEVTARPVAGGNKLRTISASSNGYGSMKNMDLNKIAVQARDKVSQALNNDDASTPIDFLVLRWYLFY